MILALIGSPIIVIVNLSNGLDISTMTMIGLLEVAQFIKGEKNMKKRTSIILGSIVCIVLATICAIVAFKPKPITNTQEAATTATTTATPTPTATPTAATTTPVEGRKKPLLDPTEDDAIPVSESWPEAAIKLWGVGDVAEKQFSYTSSHLYEDKDGTFFTLYQFRVYTYTGAAWEQTELYPMFGNRVVIDKGDRQIVLDEDKVEVWEMDYWQEDGYWNVERRFVVSAEDPGARVFGDWVFEDSEAIAYIASESANSIWAISESGISCRQYEDILFSTNDIFAVNRKELIRIGYRTTTNEEVFGSLNDTFLPVVEDNAVFMVGDTSIDPISFTGQLEEVDGSIVFSDLKGVKVIVD